MPSFASLFRHDVPFVVFVFVASPCCAECEWAVCEAANKVNVWNGEHNAWCWMLHEAGSFQPSWVPLIESLSSPKLHNAARNSRLQYVPDRRLCLPKRPWWQNKGLQQYINFYLNLLLVFGGLPSSFVSSPFSPSFLSVCLWVSSLWLWYECIMCMCITYVNVYNVYACMI